MKRNRQITRLFAFLLAVAVISAGMMIPKILIEGQRVSNLGDTQIIKMQGNAPISLIVDADISQTELINRLSSWEDIPIFREPYQNELSMEAAFSAAKREMQKLTDMGVIPDISIQQYQLGGAQLYANSVTNAAKWDIAMVSPEEKASIQLDAETGKIYRFVLGYTRSDNISNQERAVLFAQYHGVDTDEQTFEYNDNENTLKLESLTISVHSSTTADSHFEVVVSIGIAN